MNWTDCAIDDLQKYNGLKASMQNITEQLETLDLKFTSIKGVQTDRIPISGSGTNHWEEFLIDNISERERLKLLLKINKNLVNTIRRGMSALNEEERLVLDHFYIHPRANHLQTIMESLRIEKAEVYRLKDRALRKFVLYMFGVPEYFN